MLLVKSDHIRDFNDYHSGALFTICTLCRSCAIISCAMKADQRRARRGLEVYLWLICQSFFSLSSRQDQASQEQEVAFCTTDQSASKIKRRD